MASFGSMSPVMGNANQILSAPSALQQVGPSSPSFQPGTLPPSPLAVPQMAPQAPQMAQFPSSQPVPNAMPTNPQAPIGVQTAQPQGPVVGMPPGNPESLAIVKALTSRLASLTKAEKMQRNPGVSS